MTKLEFSGSALARHRLHPIHPTDKNLIARLQTGTDLSVGARAKVLAKTEGQFGSLSQSSSRGCNSECCLWSLFYVGNVVVGASCCHNTFRTLCGDCAGSFQRVEEPPIRRFRGTTPGKGGIVSWVLRHRDGSAIRPCWAEGAGRSVSGGIDAPTQSQPSRLRR